MSKNDTDRIIEAIAHVIAERIDELRTELRGEIAELRAEMNARFDQVETRLSRVEARVSAVHRDLLQLRSELQGVIDPQFPAVGSFSPAFSGAFDSPHAERPEDR